VTDNNFDSSASRSTHLNDLPALTQRGEQASDSPRKKFTFIQKAIAAPANWRRKHWVLAGAAAGMAVLSGIVIPGFAVAMRQANESMPLTTLVLDIPQLAVADQAGIVQTDEPEWRSVSVRPGQTLGSIFQQQGLSATDLSRLLDHQSNSPALCHIHPGDEFAFQRNGDGSLRAVRFDRSDSARVTVNFDGDDLRESVVDRQIERRTHVVHGVVDGSLFAAGQDAGMSDAMIAQLANAFSYDIDFIHDLRDGDNFTVVYDDVYREGERLRDGDVIAATFINRGKRYSAFRYTNNAGETLFYTEDGRQLRKEFLRMPVEFSHITSRFSSARLHPILGTMRAHQGVDFAAPTGTPIHAAGNGKIAFRGWQPGYGNVVVIQHDGHHSTLYGHMSRFAGEQVGQRVNQGQTIGFVGMTGLATGPHVHYEFRIDGQHRDPLTVTSLPAEPLPAGELTRFRSQTQPMLARLKTLEATRLAFAK
jgi:murein DD-endopeptidase MepM/ murein hydrolase activator NlpD